MAKKSNQEVREGSRSFWEEHHSSSEFQYVSERIFQTCGIGQGYDAQFSSGDPFQIRNLNLAYIVRGSIDNTVKFDPPVREASSSLRFLRHIRSDFRPLRQPGGKE